MDLSTLIENAKLLGLDGAELREYVEKEKLEFCEREERAQEREREERAQEREIRKMEIETRLKEREVELKEREVELERLRVEGNSLSVDSAEQIGPNYGAKLPKLPNFDENRDEIDSYLQRFERFALAAKWSQDTWGTTVSAYLKGTALAVYSRMSVEDSLDYDKVKEALLKRFRMTEEGFRSKLRTATQEAGETVSQYAVRLESYLSRWVELSRTNKTYDGLKDLVIREQLLQKVSKPLSVYLKERDPSSVKEMAELADKYTEAHNGQGSAQRNNEGRRCFICNGGHLARDCPAKRETANAMVSRRRGGYRHGTGREERPNIGYRYAPIPGNAQKDIAGACIDQLKECCKSYDQVTLQCGHKLPLVTAACDNDRFCKVDRLPVCSGKVGGTKVSVLRDTGCSSVVVRAGLVKAEDYTGQYRSCILIDGTVRKCPVASIDMETPYFKGTADALVMETPLYDLILGNFYGLIESMKVEEHNNLECEKTEELMEKTDAVQTRAQLQQSEAKPKPMKVIKGVLNDVGPLKLKAAQETDSTLDALRDLKKAGRIQTSGKFNTCRYFCKDGILFREFQSSKFNQGHPLKQLVVPVPYRFDIIRLAHQDTIGRHLGAPKTADIIMSQYHWPGLLGDVKRYCASCDQCQRVAPRVIVPKCSIFQMPIMKRLLTKIH